MRKIYVLILSGFLLFVLTVNIATAVSCRSLSQIGNIFYLSERSFAVFEFFKHVALESGVFLTKADDGEIMEQINISCSEHNVDPQLIVTMIHYAKSGEYSISPSGGMGVMLVRSSMKGNEEFRPYVYSANINTGVEYLSKSIKASSDLKSALMGYYYPDTKYFSDAEFEEVYILSSRIYDAYMGGKVFSDKQDNF